MNAPGEIPIFAGLDLAWSSRNNTAGAALLWDGNSGRAGLYASRARLGDNAEVLAWLETVTGRDKPALLGIDAPLVVPNTGGARPGERELNRVFRPFQAGAHPANRSLLGRYGQPPGDIRGETLVNRLAAELNFEHSPYLEPRSSVRRCFECYPHPAMVALFGLPLTLKYKRRVRAQANDRHAAYDAFRSHLASLAQAEPPLVLPPELLNQDTRKMPARDLKPYEDLLDAIVCAYVALYYWWWGPSRVRVFGNLAEGYIVSPVAAGTRSSPAAC